MVTDARAATRAQHLRGLSYVAVAGVLWGLSGTAAQVLFQQHHVEPQWLVTMRLVGSGILLYAFTRPPWPRRHWRQLLVYGVIGVAAVQYTYFAAIALSNVATATFLQYTYIAMVAGWEVLRGRSPLTAARAVALAASLVGVSLMALGGPGGLEALRLSPLALAMGLLSALTAAYYAIASAPLVRSLGAWPTMTWGFVVGAVPMVLWSPPWAVHPTGSPVALAVLTAFVVVFGTLIAFLLYLTSFKVITPTEAAITSTAEPVAAAAGALAVLGIALLPLQYAGGAAILVAVVLLRRGVAEPPPPPPA